MSTVESANFTPAIITATSAFSIWIFGQIIGAISKYREERDRRSAILKAFHAEVSFNKSKLDNFLKKLDASQAEALFKKIQDNKGLVPHIAETKHTLVYEKNVSYIHVFDSESIGMIIEFYGNLQRIRSIIDGLYLESFKSISDEGRSNVVRSIFVACDQTSHAGSLLLKCLEYKYNIPWNSRSEVVYGPSKFDKGYLDDLPGRLDRLDKSLQEAKKTLSPRD